MFKCECHQLIRQCQPIDKKTKGKKGGGGDGFAQVKHETLHLLQWKQMHLEPHHGKQFVPHHGNKEEGEALQHLKFGHRDNGSP